MASIAEQLLGEFEVNYIARRLNYTTGFTRAVLEGDRAMSDTFRARLQEFNTSAKYNRLRRAGAPVAEAQRLTSRSWATVNEAVGILDQVVALTYENKRGLKGHEDLTPDDIRDAIANDSDKSLDEFADIASQGGSA